jgi:4-alpha-glucanotransferase
MNDRPTLRLLADRVGILPAYFDIAGVERITKDSTREALLAAMGFEVSTEDGAARSLETFDRLQGEHLMAPVRVVVADPERPPTVLLNLAWGDASAVDWRVELRQEDGVGLAVSGRSEVYADDRAICVSLPVGPPPGYHILHAAVDLPDGPHEAEQSFIVSPNVCTPLSRKTQGQRAYGIWTNLYSVRSDRNWGVGDLTDLDELATKAASCGAAFVGLNPLHALHNHGHRIAPYCPVSRLHRNLLYVDIEAVAEFADCPEAQALFHSPEFQAELTRARSSQYVDYERVAALKSEILRLLFETFVQRHVGGTSDRGQAYLQYVAAQGKPLVDFATFMALHAWFSAGGQDDDDPRDWPAYYRRPDTPEVDAFRNAHRRDVDFHGYVQFELDRQLEAVAYRARQAGMSIGLFNDLAIGSALDGSDVWTFPGLFVQGIEVGAPPDPYSDTGQTWGFPPVDPHRLKAARYEYWIHLLRSSLAHAGMLRIDHVMGLFRQFWVPVGSSAAEGAYVAFPAEDLLGILALESQRHGAVIVGEDLGTVPPEVPPALERCEVLSTRVMYFERDGAGGFRPAASYSPRALVTATNHDHPPLAGFWTGRDLEIRQEIGLIKSARDLDEAKAERERTRRALMDRLVAEGLRFDPGTDSFEAILAAVHAFLVGTPCPLLGISLDDLGAETDPVNIPGVPPQRYRGWSRRMARSVESILRDPAVRALLEQTRTRLQTA